ncbi:MAG: site-2 protease family protein [Polyangiales bacterium]
MCPRCRRLVYAERLEALAREASALEATDRRAAAARWSEALPLLPPAARQRAVIGARIDTLRAEVEPARTSAPSPTPRWLAALGGAGLLLWKLKFVVVFVLSKGKLLLLGLTKWKTVLSMLVFLAAYWAAFGWPFALGFVLSIYVHEMGHVAELRRRGYPASAPMFVPGLGAFVRLHRAPKDNVEDARIGLAGPWWGLGAAIVCLLVYGVTDVPLFAALTRTGAWINLFNLRPIWQLDGGRAFRSLTRKERALATGAAFALWFFTSESMLLFVALAGTFRTFVGPHDPRGDRRGLVAYVVVLSALGGLAKVPVPGIAIE